MEQIINSNQNKIVKYVKSLQLKKIRDENREYIVEGIKMSHEALNFNADISLAVFEDGFMNNVELATLYQRLLDKKIRSIIVNQKIFKEICETESPQGVILIIKKRDYYSEVNFSKERMKIVILDSVKDPGNVGTIIRTADAFNIDAVLLSKGCVDLYNGKTIRSTMGSVFHIPLIDNLDLVSNIEDLKRSGFILMGADPHANIDISEAIECDKAAIVIGSESHGISEPVRQLLDVTFKIPMPGKAESLNAGVAAAISMYELFVKKK